MSSGIPKIMADCCKVVEVTENGKKHQVKLNIWDMSGD